MNLLLIDERLKSLEIFIQGCNNNTKCVTYSAEDSFEELNLKIQNLEVSSFTHVGFVFENEGTLKTFVSYNPFISFDESGIKNNLTTQFIKELVTIYNVQTLDFLACDLLLNPTWKSYFEYLQVQNSNENEILTVRASNDKTGNLQHGGDWVLESTNEDISNLYFNENITEWSHLLDLFTTNKYGVFLSSETVDNVYTSGFNDNNLLLRGYTYTNANALFTKNITSISSSTTEIAILTDELSNNLYVYGYNTYGMLGLNNTSQITAITKCNSPDIVNKKVVQVEFYKSGGAMFVLTDESLNNLYAGGRGGFLGLPNSNNYSTLQQISYLNQKINMISISDINNQIGLLTDEPNNNLYLSGYGFQGSWGNGTSNNSSNIFVNINVSSITTSKIVYLECGINRTAFLTNELSNNFYIAGSATSGAIGTGETSGSRTTFINVALTAGLNEPLVNTTPILNKKISKITMNKSSGQKQVCAILTNESSNNLYVCGNVSNGYLGSNDNELRYFKNINTNIQDKRVIDLMLTGLNTSTILTDESLNNIYSSGLSLYNGSTSGLFNPGEIVLQYTNVASLSHSKELFNKRVKCMSSSNYLTIVSTDDNVIYNCGLTKHSSNNYYISLREDWKYYNKIEPIGKKFIDFNALTNYILTISTESSNNLYICGTNAPIFSDSSNNYPKLVNLSLKQPALLNKKIIGLCSSDVTSFVITNESSNNLYACGGVLNSVPIGDGTLNVSNSFVNIKNNIENKKIIYVSCSNEHSSILTDENINNLYVCGKNSFGQLGNNTVDTLTTFTNITTNIENKKILKVDSLCKKKTFLITDELSNNLYACGSGRLGNNLNNNFQKTFININNDNLSNKKVIDVCSENTNENVGALTSIDYTPELFLTKPSHISGGSFEHWSGNVFGPNASSIAYSKKLNMLLIPLYNSSTYRTSIDEGSTWTLNTINNTSSNVGKNRSCIWSPEKELFCMVREYTSSNNPRISTSSDGVNWSHITTNSDNISSFSLYSVIWILELGLFCACGTGDRMLTSSNGIQWTERTISSGYMYTSVTWSKELNLLCAVGVKQNSTAGSIIATSSDGINWNTYNTTIMNNYIWSKSATVTWSSELNKFCAITLHAPEITFNTFTYNLGIHISSNGTSWNSTYLELSTIAPASQLYIHAFKYDPHNIQIISIDNKFVLSGFNRAYLISNDGLTWTRSIFSSQSTGSNGYGITYIKELNRVFCTLSPGYLFLPLLSNNFYFLGTGSHSGGNLGNANIFMNMFPSSINGKRFINLSVGNGFTKLISNEEDNNVYFAGNNTFGQLGNGTLNGTFQFNKPKLNISLKAPVYVPPVTVAPVTISSNSQTNAVKYLPKAVNIGSNNQIFFPDPTKTSIAIAPVQTTEAVQKYESILNVSNKNVVSGYLKLEPAGTTFEKHISLEFDVDPFIQPVVYFKSSSDPAPVLIPSSNNSSNDVYYIANTSTGRVTLYTRHFSEAIVTQDQSTINPPLNFVLSKFNTLLAMGVSGELFKESIPVMDVSGIAEYYVQASDMRNVFVFQTDSKDINNVSNQDVKYFVRKNQWPQGLVLNPCHAWVQTSKQIASSDKSGLIPDDKQLVKHDFIRYIAKSMFNTHLGVDLFQNESELKYDLAYKGHNSAWSSIWDSITSISDVSLNTTTYSGLYGTDVSYGYYLTNDSSNNSNICRQLLGQIASTAPSRLQNITSYSIDLSNGYYSVPLIDGDSISFKLTLQTAPNQHLLLNSATPIQPRSYQIRVNLRDTVTRGTTHQNGTNLIVNDPLPDTYLGSVPTDDLNTSYPANYV